MGRALLRPLQAAAGARLLTGRSESTPMSKEMLGCLSRQGRIRQAACRAAAVQSRVRGWA